MYFPEHNKILDVCLLICERCDICRRTYKLYGKVQEPLNFYRLSSLPSVNGPLTIEWRFGISFRLLVPPLILSPVYALPLYTASRLLMPFLVLPMTSGSLRDSRVIEFRLLPSIQPNFFTRSFAVQCPPNNLTYRRTNNTFTHKFVQITHVVKISPTNMKQAITG